MGEGLSRYYDGPMDNSNKLISAAAKGQTEVVAKLLTKRGKKISKRDERGDTALHKASAMGHVEVIQQLIGKGADMVKNGDGFTPFHLAVMCGRVRSGKVLLEAFKDIKDELLSDPFPKNPGIFLDYSVEERSGVCTWVIRNFSKLEDKKVSSQVFQIGGVYWRLILYPRGSQNDDNVSLYVEVANTDDLVNDWSYLTNFSFTVVSQNCGDKKVRREVIGHRFYKNHTDLGFLQMVKRNLLYDSKLGMLSDDQLVIEFDMEVVESTNYSLDAMSDTFTWKIQNFPAIKERASSYKFDVGGCSWTMSIYPRGKGNNQCLSLYLKVAESSMDPGWFYLVNFQFSLVNLITGAKFSRQESKNFRKGVEDWGFPQFIKLSTLFNSEAGYMIGDTILVELQMEVIDRHRPSSRRGLAGGLNFSEMRSKLDNMRFTPLHWAAYMNSESGCKELVEAGAPINATDARNRTALDWAAMQGDFSTAQILIESGIDINSSDSEGYLAIHKAVLGANPKVVELLLASGADPNAVTLAVTPPAVGTPKTVTSPHIDSEGSNDVGRDNDVEEGMAVHSLNHSYHLGSTPLQLAFRFNKYDMCTLLLKNSVDTQTIDAHGRSHLHYAAYDGLVDLVKLLLEKGAPPASEDKDGYLPLHKAIWKGREKCIEALLSPKLYPKTIDCQSKLGLTPLHIAVKTNAYSTVQLLIKLGAKVDLMDTKQETALHKACLNGNIKIASLLVTEGHCSLNPPDETGRTPLDYAVKREDIELIIFLLEQGAKIPKKDKDSSNLLMSFFSRKLEEFHRDTLITEDEKLNSSSTLSDDMRFLVNNKSYTDVVFMVEDQPVYALRGILVARSEFFRVMFGSALQESTKTTIDITDVKYTAFVQVMEFIYTDTIDTSNMCFDDAVLLLSAANRYMLERLKRMCESFIIKNIRLLNVSFIFQAADLYGAHHLRSTAMHFIANHYQSMVDINEVTQTQCFSEWLVDFFRKYLKNIEKPQGAIQMPVAMPQAEK
eukprot:TRINITY_DN9669_c0_g1_i2.p1 TRINITY_DN9669_c0_g1~~TRINITY_DN9669_c0_g1_i2.p1  ORF type:complete len:1002 (+),score=159.74 TRINITY_DN9669_c0_g1_i2:85-3090(+)